MKKIKSYIILLLCLFLASLNFNLILKELNLVTGGTQGLAILLNYLVDLSPSLIIFLINTITLIISIFFLPVKNTSGALVSSLIYPLFIKLTSYIHPIPFLQDYKLIFIILSGIIFGITSGFIYKYNFSSGGLTIINLLIHKYFHIKISIINFIINSIIILFGYFYFGITKTLFSILVIIIGSIIINIIIGFKCKKL